MEAAEEMGGKFSKTGDSPSHMETLQPVCSVKARLCFDRVIELWRLQVSIARSATVWLMMGCAGWAKEESSASALLHMVGHPFSPLLPRILGELGPSFVGG